MDRLPSASVIVVGYQSRRHLEGCLRAVFAQRYPGEVEVVFVDNASTDGSIDYVRSTFPSATIVETGTNLGYAGGNNLGAKRARGDILVFLNPDTEVAAGWLAELVRPLVADSTIGLTTSKILLMGDRETVNACGNDISLCGITWCRGAGLPSSAFVTDADVMAVSGCAFAMEAALFRRLGGFDASFFMYLEDADLSWRARVAGYRCRFVAASVVYHDYRLTFSPAKVARIEQNRYRMLGKHLSLRGLVALLPTLVLGEVLTWGYAAVRGPAYLAAKARVSGWSLVHLSAVLRTKDRAAESRILREHAVAPPVVGGAGGSFGRAVQVAVAQLFRGAATIAFALLPTSSVGPLVRRAALVELPGWLTTVDHGANGLAKNGAPPSPQGRRRDRMTASSAPLRIAHVTATFPPYYGGTGNVCYHNARALAERGHEVHVYTAAWPGEPDDPSGVVVHRFKPLARVGNAPVLPQLLQLRRSTLIHLHHPFYAGAEFVALSGRPYVVTYHQDVQRSGIIGRATSLHDRTVGRYVLGRAARLCPTTLDYLHHSTIADHADRLGDRVVAIPNGVDVGRYWPGPIEVSVRRRFGLAEDQVVVLFVGAMDHAHFFKGVPTLLRALAGIPDVSALLVGEGDLRPSYERLARELDLDTRVVFTGRVPDGELPRIYRAADALVLPSETRGEAFGLVLLEAMASGRPVIATDLPGVRSIVSHGVDGFLVPPGDGAALGDAIVTMARMSPETRMVMGAAGRAKVEKSYAWERIAERLETLYREVLAERVTHDREAMEVS